MAAKLKQGKSLIREIQLRFLPGPVNVTMNTEGIIIAVKGSRKPIMIDWATLINKCVTDANVPAKFFGRGLELLTSEFSRKKSWRAKHGASCSVCASSSTN